LIFNKKAVSMISIFILISVLSIFAFTLIELINRQLDMRDNSKKSTAINFIAEAALSEIMNYLRLRPDRLKNVANVFEGAKITSYSSRHNQYVPEDIIGTFYSNEMPGKFKFEQHDLEKKINIELAQEINCHFLSVTQEEGIAVKLKIYGASEGGTFVLLYNAQTDTLNEITGTEINLEYEEPFLLKNISLEYGDADVGEIDEISVYENFFYNEGEIKTDVSDNLFKYIYNYKVLGNKIYITARNVIRESSGEKWRILSSFSMQARYMIDSGGNLVIFDKKNSSNILEFPKMFE